MVWCVTEYIAREKGSCVFTLQKLTCFAQTMHYSVLFYRKIKLCLILADICCDIKTRSQQYYPCLTKNSAILPARRYIPARDCCGPVSVCLFVCLSHPIGCQLSRYVGVIHVSCGRLSTTCYNRHRSLPPTSSVLTTSPSSS